MKEVTYAIFGYGGRGSTFAELLKKPQFFGKVVAVAEPDHDRRARAIKECNLPADRVFNTAEELLAQPKLADAVINATQDQMHARTSIPAMQKGYHLFLEKPMAVTLEDCLAIERTQRETGVVVGICHSMRYQTMYANLKAIIDSGAIGDIITIDQLEGVGDVHQSSSFVRGNWGNEGRSTFMLMAKSCHDIDLFSYLIGRPCERVSSFGSLTYFTERYKPTGAPKRCLDGCPAERECQYHCAKVYLETTDWRFVFSRKDDASVIEYLRTGPYGRCVFQTDNDVVDHQVVNFEFEGGVTTTFTMTAFHPGGRFIRVHGTKGCLESNTVDMLIKHHDFSSGNYTELKPAQTQGSHGGGDYLTFRSITEAIRAGDPQAVLTTAQASLQSHLIVFAAEKARREQRVVEMSEFTALV